MRDKTYHIYLDSHERKLLLHSLVKLKNQLIQQGKYRDCVDEIIFKVINALIKEAKIEYVYSWLLWTDFLGLSHKVNEK